MTTSLADSKLACRHYASGIIYSKGPTSCTSRQGCSHSTTMISILRLPLHGNKQPPTVSEAYAARTPRRENDEAAGMHPIIPQYNYQALLLRRPNLPTPLHTATLHCCTLSKVPSGTLQNKYSNLALETLSTSLMQVVSATCKSRQGSSEQTNPTSVS